eukprot:gnl/TRDRNA2_/TRDRNA2_144046_c1_seq2.p1 gnl/TRDRNA2_/TRDRNA2_144046_c1~~gnl/TRDRNA2_/TRDRNA2_144046_c1_seq2.p1  ORF type:complete len:238 (+),score=8.68 gnl/TRDRNA2_/TRDRNA2_144046_c1_seq2:78-791(+)
MLNDEQRAGTLCANPACNRRLCHDPLRSLNFCCYYCELRHFGSPGESPHGTACNKKHLPPPDARRAPALPTPPPPVTPSKEPETTESIGSKVGIGQAAQASARVAISRGWIDRSQILCANPNCQRRLCKDPTFSLNFCCYCCESKHFGLGHTKRAHGPACCDEQPSTPIAIRAPAEMTPASDPENNTSSLSVDSSNQDPVKGAEKESAGGVRRATFNAHCHPCTCRNDSGFGSGKQH